MFRKRESDVADVVSNARPAPKPRPAWRRTWTPGILLLTAIGVGVPVTFAVIGTRLVNDPSVGEWSSRRPASEAKVRALGLPLRFDELPSREAGAAAAMRELGVLAEKGYERHKTWSPAHEAKIRATFLRAGREESMTYPRKWEEGIGLLYGNLPDWKTAAKMVAEDADRAVAVNDGPRLATNLLALERVGTFVSSEPSEYSFALGVAIRATGERTALRALNGRPTPEVRAAVARYVKARRPLPDLVPAFGHHVTIIVDLTSSPAAFNKLFSEYGVEALNAGKEPTPMLFEVDDKARLAAWRAYALDRLATELTAVREGRPVPPRPPSPGAASHLWSFLAPEIADIAGMIPRLKTLRARTDTRLAAIQSL